MPDRCQRFLLTAGPSVSVRASKRPTTSFCSGSSNTWCNAGMQRSPPGCCLAPCCSTPRAPRVPTREPRPAPTSRRGWPPSPRATTTPASTSSRTAYDILPHPNVLYNIARAYADVGDLENAVAYYKRYLEGNPKDRDEVAQIVASLEARIRSQQAQLLEAQQPRRRPRRGPRGSTAPGGAGPGAGTAPGGATGPGGMGRAGAAGRVAAAPWRGGSSRPKRSSRRRSSRRRRAAQSPLDAPNSTSIITEQDIRLSGITKIPELLRRLAGVDIMEVTGAQTEVSLRGFNQRLSNKVLVLVDGRSVYIDLARRHVLGDAARSASRTSSASRSCAARARRSTAPTRSTASSTSSPRPRARAGAASTPATAITTRRTAACGRRGRDKESRGASPPATTTSRAGAARSPRAGGPPHCSPRPGRCRSVGPRHRRPTCTRQLGKDVTVGVGRAATSTGSIEILGDRPAQRHRPRRPRRRDVTACPQLEALRVRALLEPHPRRSTASTRRTSGSRCCRRHVDTERGRRRGAVHRPVRDGRGVEHDLHVGAEYRFKEVHWTYLAGRDREPRRPLRPRRGQDRPHASPSSATSAPTTSRTSSASCSRRAASVLFHPTKQSTIRGIVATAFRTPTFLESYLSIPSSSRSPAARSSRGPAARTTRASRSSRADPHDGARVPEPGERLLHVRQRVLLQPRQQPHRARAQPRRSPSATSRTQRAARSSSRRPGLTRSSSAASRTSASVQRVRRRARRAHVPRRGPRRLRQLHADGRRAGQLALLAEQLALARERRADEHAQGQRRRPAAHEGRHRRLGRLPLRLAAGLGGAGQRRPEAEHRRTSRSTSTRTRCSTRASATGSCKPGRDQRRRLQPPRTSTASTRSGSSSAAGSWAISPTGSEGIPACAHALLSPSHARSFGAVVSDRVPNDAATPPGGRAFPPAGVIRGTRALPAARILARSNGHIVGNADPARLRPPNPPPPTASPPPRSTSASSPATCSSRTSRATGRRRRTARSTTASRTPSRRARRSRSRRSPAARTCSRRSSTTRATSCRRSSSAICPSGRHRRRRHRHGRRAQADNAGNPNYMPHFLPIDIGNPDALPDGGVPGLDPQFRSPAGGLRSQRPHRHAGGRASDNASPYFYPGGNGDLVDTGSGTLTQSEVQSSAFRPDRARRYQLDPREESELPTDPPRSLRTSRCSRRRKRADGARRRPLRVEASPPALALGAAGKGGTAQGHGGAFSLPAPDRRQRITGFPVWQNALFDPASKKWLAQDIPEGQGIPQLWPLVVLTKLVDNPAHKSIPRAPSSKGARPLRSSSFRGSRCSEVMGPTRRSPTACTTRRRQSRLATSSTPARAGRWSSRRTTSRWSCDRLRSASIHSSIRPIRRSVGRSSPLTSSERRRTSQSGQ